MFHFPCHSDNNDETVGQKCLKNASGKPSGHGALFFSIFVKCLVEFFSGTSNESASSLASFGRSMLFKKELMTMLSGSR